MRLALYDGIAGKALKLLRSSNNLVMWLAVVAIAFGWATALPAGVFRFDPDGDAPSANGLDVDTLDWAPGNALSVNGTTAQKNFIAGSGSTTFDLFYQAKLANLQLGGAIVTPSNLGPGGANELTVVAGMSQSVIFVAGATQVSSLAPLPTVSYLEIYFDSTRDASDLAGTGFTDELTGDTDGTLILSGSIISAVSNFTVSGGGAGTPLDAFGVDNYPTVDSVLGVGGTNVTATVTFFDPAFFDLPSGTTIDVSLFSSGQSLNFRQVDPSAKFLTTTSTTASMIDPVFAGAGVGLASLGTVNGSLGPSGGPDIQFQVDGSSVLNIVPEPSTISLFAAAVCSLLTYNWRRKRKSAA